ncbi:gamma-glutamyltransferase [Isachenkonia alkalipeptolytica]|uniref:Glutathione hydrolase proenzyme n=2 Tax=Isachenkonia alkalipeptolytica TaxID=2565777 RepID=A0AA44BCU9_9CLOT|nr:gamma-glutamyltransferase [Isachenkonia alkalipeptolytica]
MVMEKKQAPVYRSKNGMVSSASKQATEVGAEILAKGGNAFDAATAVSYCLGVTEPQASGIGGQSMAVVYLAAEKRYFALDGSSIAPYHFQPKDMPKKPLKLGLKATTLPSTPAFYGYLSDNYGTLPLKELLAPAIKMATKGFPVTPLIHSLIERSKEELKKDPQAKENFLPQGKPLKAGEILIQPELGKMMGRMGEKGWQDFYTGEIGKEIIRDMEARGGLLTAEDLSQIPIPIERPVLEGKYRKYGIITFPPPGAGRVLMQILNILENFTEEDIDLDSPYGSLILALAFQLTLRDRKQMPQNPDIYFQQSARKMTNKKYSREVTENIRRIIDKYSETVSHLPPDTSGETTHFSVADGEGNIVAVTQSIELVFGAKRTAQGLGFFYNNYMSAFEYKDRTHPYYLLPGNKPWSSVAPTIVTSRKKPLLVLGSPGSERISTALSQVLLRYLDGKQDLSRAIEEPRFHTSDLKKMQLEKKRFSREIESTFEETGFDIRRRGSYSFYLGCVQGIELPHKKNGYQFYGVADPRRDGAAKGPE